MNQSNGNLKNCRLSFSEFEEFSLKESQVEWREMERRQKISAKEKEQGRNRDWKRKESWEQDKMILESQFYSMPGMNKAGKFCHDMLEVNNKPGKNHKNRPLIHWKTQKKKKK